MEALRASCTLLAASVRWTIIWSVHQYQTPRIGAPNRTPVHGNSGWFIAFHTEKNGPGIFSLRPTSPPTSGCAIATTVSTIPPPMRMNAWMKSV